MNCAVIAAALLVAAVKPAGPVQTEHRRSPYVGAIAIEAPSGRVLLSDNATRECYPASCTKLMTARLLLKAMKAGRVRRDERLAQSRVSAAEQPSKIDLLPGETIGVDDALTALMLKSANDVAVIIAERLAGSVQEFAKVMNAEAKALGMLDTVFVSPNGLPPPPGSKRGFDRSTAVDLATLANAMLKEQPEILSYTRRASATVPGRKGAPLTLQNHNKFLWKKGVKMAEVDGLKTGYIDAGGSSIVLTGTRRGKRAIVVVVGSSTSAEREAAAGRMLQDALGAIAW